MEIEISAKQPFSLRSVVFSHGWIRLLPFEEDEEAGGFKYVLRLDGGRVVGIRVRQASSGVLVETDDLIGGDERAQIVRDVTWMLGLDLDFSAFYAVARTEPKLAHVEAEAKGRILRSPTLFEDTVKTMLTTNTAWSGTKRMVKALVENLGEPSPDEPGRRAFPTPGQLADADEKTLRNDIKLGYRAPYVLELAQKVASGDLDLETLRASDLPTQELYKRLLDIKGIGAYAAANLLMILGRYDFIPIDSWAVKTVSQEFHNGQPVGKADVEAAFERWGAWKGLAFWFWDYE